MIGYCPKHTWDVGICVCVCEGQLLGNRLLLQEMKTQTLGLLKHPPAYKWNWVKIQFLGFPDNLKFVLMSEFRLSVACFKAQCQHLANVKSFYQQHHLWPAGIYSRFCGTLSLKNLRGLIWIQNHVYKFEYKLSFFY